MVCPRCHGNIPNKNEKFCQHCGFPLENEKKSSNKKILIPVSITGVCLLVILISVLIFQKDTSASRLQVKINEGNRYLKQKDYDNAEIAFNDALKISKDSSEAKVGLADTYTHLNKPEQAAEMISQAQSNPPSSSSPMYDRYQYYTNQYHVGQNSGGSTSGTQTTVYQVSNSLSGSSSGNTTGNTSTGSSSGNTSSGNNSGNSSNGNNNTGNSDTGNTSSDEENSNNAESSEENTEGEEAASEASDEELMDDGTVSVGELNMIVVVPYDEESEQNSDSDWEDSDAEQEEDEEDLQNENSGEELSDEGQSQVAADLSQEEEVTPTPEEVQAASEEAGEEENSGNADEEEWFSLTGDENAQNASSASDSAEVVPEDSSAHAADVSEGPQNTEEGDEATEEVWSDVSTASSNDASEDAWVETETASSAEDSEEETWTTGEDTWTTGEDSWSTGGDTWSTGEDTWSTGEDTWSTGEDTWSTGEDTWSTGEDWDTETTYAEGDETSYAAGEDTSYEGSVNQETVNTGADEQQILADYQMSLNSGAVSQTLQSQLLDVDGDGSMELVVAKNQGNSAFVEVYKVENGMAVMKGSASSSHGFGTCMAGEGYLGTQAIALNGTSIVIASEHIGVNMGDGSGVETDVETWTIQSDGSVMMGQNASMTNGNMPDGLISALSTAGMSTDWVSSHAAELSSMDLSNDPSQIYSVNNPIQGGIPGGQSLGTISFS